MATRRRTNAGRHCHASIPGAAEECPEPAADPGVVRSIHGLTLLVVGAMTLIALLPWIPERDADELGTDVFAPWFGTMRWMLPFLLLLAVVARRGPGTRDGWVGG